MKHWFSKESNSSRNESANDFFSSDRDALINLQRYKWFYFYMTAETSAGAAAAASNHIIKIKFAIVKTSAKSLGLFSGKSVAIRV